MENKVVILAQEELNPQSPLLGLDIHTTKANYTSVSSKITFNIKTLQHIAIPSNILIATSNNTHSDFT